MAKNSIQTWSEKILKEKEERKKKIKEHLDDEMKSEIQS